MDGRPCAALNVGAWDRALRAVGVAALFAVAPLVIRPPYWLVAVGVGLGLLLETTISAY